MTTGKIDRLILDGIIPRPQEREGDVTPQGRSGQAERRLGPRIVT